MQKLTNERLGEEIQLYQHKSGLTVAVIPKKGYNKTYAMFATRFGSVDNAFRLAGEKEYRQIPDGIAHFLEHKLFDNEDGNAFEKYAATGASANAFTGFDKTAYLFSATDQVMESLEILVDFVSRPYFTAESVAKEQGIIGQEIRMYDDDGEWRVMFNLLGALYQKNPVAIDIAGTVESISHITHETLYDCYHTFYNLHNMVLCVVGDVQAQDVLAVCDKVLKPAPKLEVECKDWQEPEEISRPLVEQALPVSTPLFRLGFKDTGCVWQGREAVKREWMVNILLEMLAGKASSLYESLYQDGLVNSGFESEYMAGRGFGVAMLGGESRDPQAVQARVMQELQRMMQADNHALFQRCKKSLYALAVRQFNSVDNIANLFVTYHLLGASLFDFVDVFDDIQYEECMALMRELFVESKMALSVIRPV
ncbi:MAG: EF-P 5-aminopentanol modification-associated protein YfmH [Eubacteriales bacterium]|jgi:predicted Zn-dependent peptidase